MVGTTLYWVPGPWQGGLALASRPRGNDWLQDEMAAWRSQGIDTVVSLLEVDEADALGLSEEPFKAAEAGIQFVSFPIGDRSIPGSTRRFSEIVDSLDRDLSAGRKVLVHCRQGIGRTGLIAGGLLIVHGHSPELAIEEISRARGVTMPETVAQSEYLGSFANTLATYR